MYYLLELHMHYQGKNLIECFFSNQEKQKFQKLKRERVQERVFMFRGSDITKDSLIQASNKFLYFLSIMRLLKSITPYVFLHSIVNLQNCSKYKYMYKYM